MPADALQSIIDYKHLEVADRKRAHSESDLIEICNTTAQPPRDFFKAVTSQHNLPTRVIAEIKRQSPSAGLIRPEYNPSNTDPSTRFDPARIARAYTNAGAAAISCLTDQPSFGGQLPFLNTVKHATHLPVLRKDFIIDPWQILESRAAGADAILLIAECLDTTLLKICIDISHNQGMTSLIEIHTPENLSRVLPIIQAAPPTSCLLGINNRDLSRMHTDISHSITLADQVPDRSILVSESGIRTNNDLQSLKQAGISIVLVGEHLMRSHDPGAALAELLVGR